MTGAVRAIAGRSAIAITGWCAAPATVAITTIGRAMTRRTAIAGSRVIVTSAVTTARTAAIGAIGAVMPVVTAAKIVGTATVVAALAMIARVVGTTGGQGTVMIGDRPATGVTGVIVATVGVTGSPGQLARALA